MVFRENLKQKLNFNGMLVKELAAAAGVHKRTIDAYLLSENVSMPPADVAVRIAKTLGVSVEHLVTGGETSLPNDIRNIIRFLLQLDTKNRKVVSVLVNALINRKTE
ncbi:MAG: helix-turn-helix domain-containing protein [Treponema sp.]|jgi:transcriptional regulator with XRE-family HTH domain|nr:helix-turn-helix domain-containing protein [Treponema sp.]